MRESSNDVSAQVWREWILDAIGKIRFQKQRPSIQRICQAIGNHHKFHEDIVAQKLEEAVKSGAVVKVYNKGLHSYKDPRPLQGAPITVNLDTDLSKLVVRAVKELGECEGSVIKSIENYVQQSNNIILEENTDFKQVIKNSLSQAVNKDLLICEGKFYKLGNILTTPKKKMDGPDKLAAKAEKIKLKAEKLKEKRERIERARADKAKERADRVLNKSNSKLKSPEPTSSRNETKSSESVKVSQIEYYVHRFQIT